MKYNYFVFALLTTLIVAQNPPTTMDPVSYLTLPFNMDHQLEKNQEVSYSFTIRDRKESYSVLLSLAESSHSATEMFVSFKNSNPSKPQDADRHIKGGTGNILMLSPTDLKGATAVHVTIKCVSNNCELSFSAGFAHEAKATANGEELSLRAQELEGVSALLVSLYIPEVSEVDRIVIHGEALGRNTPDQPFFNMYITQDSKLVTMGRHFRFRRFSWFESKTQIVRRDNEMFCQNCYFTVALHFPAGQGVKFTANSFANPQLLTSKAIVDGVRQDHFNTYVYKVDTEDMDKDLIIYVQPYIGIIEAFITCGTGYSKDYYNPDYHFTLERFEEIIITAKEHEQCQEGVYYITLIPQQFGSLYSIRIWTKSSSGVLLLDEKATATGDILPDETIEYEFYLPHMAAEGFSISIEKLSKVKSKLINCRLPTDCPGLPIAEDTTTPPDNSPSSPVIDFIYTEESLGTTHTLAARFEDGCVPVNLKFNWHSTSSASFCAYKLIITSQEQEKKEYEIKLRIDGHHLLFPGRARQFEITGGGTEYFMMHVPFNAEDIQFVTFQLTRFSGWHIEMWASNSDPKPKADANSVQAFEGYVAFMNLFEDNKLNGTYYVSVTCERTCSFALSGDVYNKEGTREDYAVRLTQGVPQKGVLAPNHQIESQFFKFDVLIAEGWEGFIRISVNSVNGKLLLTANPSNHVPSRDSARWKSRDNHLYIYSNDTDFKREGTYYVGVFLDLKDSSTRHQNNILFYIDYSISIHPKDDDVIRPHHKLLTSEYPYSGEIMRDEVIYFKFDIFSLDAKVTIYISSDAALLGLYVSLEGEKYPTKTTCTEKLEGEPYLTIEKGDITKFCKGRWDENGVCTNYLALTFYQSLPKGIQSARYSISLARVTAGADSNPIMLIEGVEQNVHLASETAKSYFYFYPSSIGATTITVSSYGYIPTIYANVRANTNKGDYTKLGKDYPTEKSYDYATQVQDRDHLGIAVLSLPTNKTSDSLVVTLEISLARDPAYTSLVAKDPSFKIVASSTFFTLKSGTTFFGYVEENQYSYYTIWVSDPSATIVITLTTYGGGDPDLYVSKGEIPTVDNHRFASSNKVKTEVLTISLKDAYPLKSMEGEWIIGVYGVEYSVYSITVTFDSNMVVGLTPSTPLQLYLQEGTSMTLRYFHDINSDFDVTFDIQSGSLLFVNKNEEIMDKRISVSKNSPNYCTRCNYEFLIQALSSAQFTVTVTVGDDPIIPIFTGLTYEDTLEPNGHRRYVFNGVGVSHITLAAKATTFGLRIFASHNPKVSPTSFTWEAEYEETNAVLNIHADSQTPPSKNSEEHSDMYYIYLYNSGKEKVNFSFAVGSDEGFQILKEGTRYDKVLKPKGIHTFMYYSPYKNTTIEILLEYALNAEDLGLGQTYNYDIVQGLDFSALYWTEKSTSGPGIACQIEANDVVVYSKSKFDKRIHLKQTILLKGFVGRYQINIGNLYDSTIEYSILTTTAQLQTRSFIGDVWHPLMLNIGNVETIVTYIPSPGAVYIDINRCDGDFDVVIGDSLDEVVLPTAKKFRMQNDESHFVASKMAAPGYKYIKVIPLNTAANRALVNEYFANVKVTYFGDQNVADLEKIQPGTINSVGYSNMYQNKKQEYLQVEFSPIDLEPLLMSDRSKVDIQYHVAICPTDKQADISTTCSLANKFDDCSYVLEENDAATSVSLVLPKRKQQSSTLSVSMAAVINYGGKTVRTIPYKSMSLGLYYETSQSFVERITRFIGYIVIGFIIILVGYFVFKGLKKINKNTAIEMQKIINKKQGYGMMDVDEI